MVSLFISVETIGRERRVPPRIQHDLGTQTRKGCASDQRGENSHPSPSSSPTPPPRQQQRPTRTSTFKNLRILPATTPINPQLPTQQQAHSFPHPPATTMNKHPTQQPAPHPPETMNPEQQPHPPAPPTTNPHPFKNLRILRRRQLPSTPNSPLNNKRVHSSIPSWLQ